MAAALAATALALNGGALAFAQSAGESAASAPADRLTNTGASNLVPTPSDGNDAPNLSEIPPVGAALPDDASASTTGSQTATDPNEITRYEQEQSGMPPEQLKSLREYDSGSELSTSLGMQLVEERRTLNSGEEADGLLVVGVKKGSPAAEAGLHAYDATKHDMITGVAMAGAMFFPPAILLIPALDYSAIGESYDLIIGVDGARVRNFLDYQDRTRDAQPGETIYLSVVRDGKRLQMKLPLPPAPPNLTQATN
jgi:hypothetical protein